MVCPHCAALALGTQLPSAAGNGRGRLGRASATSHFGAPCHADGFPAGMGPCRWQSEGTNLTAAAGEAHTGISSKSTSVTSTPMLCCWCAANSRDARWSLCKASTGKRSQADLSIPRQGSKFSPNCAEYMEDKTSCAILPPGILESLSSLLFSAQQAPPSATVQGAEIARYIPEPWPESVQESQ